MFVVSLMVDCVLVGFVICDCELIVSQTCGLDCGIVPPVLEFPQPETTSTLIGPYPGIMSIGQPCG